MVIGKGRKLMEARRINLSQVGLRAMYIVQWCCSYINETGVQRGLRVPLTRMLRHIPTESAFPTGI